MTFSQCFQIYLQIFLPMHQLGESLISHHVFHTALSFVSFFPKNTQKSNCNKYCLINPKEPMQLRKSWCFKTKRKQAFRDALIPKTTRLWIFLGRNRQSNYNSNFILKSIKSSQLPRFLGHKTYSRHEPGGCVRFPQYRGKRKFHN